MSEENPLEDVFSKVDEAEEASEKFSSWQKQIREVKQELAGKVQELEEDEEISSTKAEHILKLVQNAQYGEAREEIREAYEKQGLEFDAEEKNLFAQRFTEEFQKLQADTQRIRNSLLDLRDGLDREDMVSHLYGKHSGMNKTDLREVFDTLDRIDSSELSVDDQARVLAGLNRNLTITATRKILKEIQKEADIE